MAYTPREIDYKNINTRGAVRRTSQEEIEASRVKAAGRPASNRGRNPEFKEWASAHLADVVSRTLTGPPQVGGNLTNYTLSSLQFAQWRKTGGWEGHPEMPTIEEASAPDPKPDHREWTPVKEV